MRPFLIKNSPWIIAALLVLNLGMAAVIFFAPKPGQPPPPGRMVRLWTKELDLSEEQIRQFEALEKIHRSRGEALHRRMIGLKQQLIETVVEYPGDTTRLQTVVVASDSVHRQLNNHLIDYYFDLKKVCTPDQQKKLAAVYGGMLNLKEK
jgi:Spy/CpxP family protein refolding chaperone